MLLQQHFLSQLPSCWSQHVKLAVLSPHPDFEQLDCLTSLLEFGPLDWDFRNIRQFLTQDAAVSVANAFVSSRLDYCNSLFRSLSKASLHRLQSIQNCAARIVTNSCRYTRITPVLRKLHWLPIQFRSEFKLATLVYKFIHTGFPKYFAPHLSTYRTTYNTKS